MLEKELQAIGLSDKEARVYLAALELGQASAQQIATKANVNRATTYVAIESLTKIGMMSSFHQAKKQFFVATRPDRFIELADIERSNIESKKARLQRLMPQLHSIHNRKSNKPVVRFYEGKEGLLVMNEEANMGKADLMHLVYSVDAVNNLYTDEERKRLSEKRIHNKIRNQVIYSYKNGRKENNELSNRRKVPLDKFQITADISVSGDVIRLANISSKVCGIVIEDHEIAQTLAAIMNLAWEAAEKYDKEKA